MFSDGFEENISPTEKSGIPWQVRADPEQTRADSVQILTDSCQTRAASGPPARLLGATSSPPRGHQFATCAAKLRRVMATGATCAAKLRRVVATMIYPRSRSDQADSAHMSMRFETFLVVLQKSGIPWQVRADPEQTRADSVQILTDSCQSRAASGPPARLLGATSSPPRGQQFRGGKGAGAAIGRLGNSWAGPMDISQIPIWESGSSYDFHAF